MTPQHPAAPETETDANGLTEAEIDALRGLAFTVPDRVRLEAAVERIVAERVRFVEGERDAAWAQADDWAAQFEGAACEADEATARAESAEAAHEAEKAAHERLRAGVEALADGDLWEHADALHALLLGGGEAR